MSKTILVNPPFTQSAKAGKRCTQPIGILGLATYLSKRGHEVKILDSMLEGYDHDLIHSGVRTYGLPNAEIARRVVDYNPDYLGVSVLMTPNLKSALAICELVKSLNPKIQTIMGGGGIYLAEDIIEKPSIDHVVVGEGEESLRKIVEGESEGIVKSPLMNLDELPIPDRRFLSMEKYFEINMHTNTYSPYKRTVMLESSRGCPFNCCFCAVRKVWGKSFRGKTLENVKLEIIDIITKYKAQELDFIDPNLIYDRKRAIDLFTMMIELQQTSLGKFAWGNYGGIYVAGLDDEVLELIKESGAYQISLAVENANEHILYDIIHKPIKLEKVPGIVEKSKQLGLDLHVFFVTGFPEESLEDMWRNYEFAKKADFTSASFNIVSPLPGSEIYEKYKEYADPMNVSFDTAVIPHPSLSKEDIEREVNKMNEEFNRGLWHRHPIHFLRKYVWWGGIKRGRNPLNLFRSQ